MLYVRTLAAAVAALTKRDGRIIARPSDGFLNFGRQAALSSVSRGGSSLW